MWVMTLALLAVTPVVAPWTVETAPLLPDGLELTQVQPLSGQRVALLAHSEAGETWALMLMELGQTPELVQAFHDEPRFVHPEGTQVFVLAGAGPTNVYRLDERGDVKHLGTFDFLIDDLACTADAGQCVLATESALLAVGRVSRVVQSDLHATHVTINPSGTFITHDLPTGGCEALRSLDPKVPQVTAVCESRSRRFASYDALEHHFEEEGSGENGWCGLAITGWLGDSVVEVTLSSMGEVECGQQFRLDRRTLARSKVPVVPYPWEVLPCPQGGWQSAAGRIVTSCTEVIQLMMRGRPRRECGPECEPPPALPEAIALSAESVFIDVVKPASFSFERGRVKVPFKLDGPSVVTMNAKGVVVQPIAWPGGVITHSFDDGWHLLHTQHAQLTVHFVQAD